MEHTIFIVAHEGTYYGPFNDHEASGFAARLQGHATILPLMLPSVLDEASSTLKIDRPAKRDHRAHRDNIKIDTLLVLAGVTQGFFLTRRERRVLTVHELDVLWNEILAISHSVESLMDHVEQVIADPGSESLVALRKALWRNRGSDDVDPHHHDRSW